MSFGFSVENLIASSQLAFTLYRKCYLGARGAPQEFQPLVYQLACLSTFLQMLEKEVVDENSVLLQIGEDQSRVMKETIDRVEGTLKQLEKFAGKYAKLLDPGRSKVKKAWVIVNWSTEMADIDDLENQLVYHNESIDVLLMSARNSSKQHLETATLKHERQPSSTALMKNVKATSPWKAIGIIDWICAGRWWLLKYQHQMQHDLGSGNVVPHTVYKSLIKASWILRDVITKHPQLSLLDTAIQYDIKALTEGIDEEFKNIDSKKLQVPRLADLDKSELHIWEKQAVRATEDISHSLVGQSSGEAWKFELLLKTFGSYQHTTGLRVRCYIQLFAHQHEKVIRLHMYDQRWNLQAELVVDPSTRSTMHCKDEGIFVDGRWVILGTEEAISLHLIFAALVEYVWWYRRMSEPKSLRSCYIRSFCMIFAIAFGYKQFIENPGKINHMFLELSNSGDDHFGLVESSRTVLKGGSLPDERKQSQMREELDNKGEALLPWMVKTCISDWIAIKLQYAKMHHIEQGCSLWGNIKHKELKKTAMGYWKYFRKHREPVLLFDYCVAGIVLEFAGGCGMVAKLNSLDLIDSDFQDGDANSRARVRVNLGSAFIEAAACGDHRVVDLIGLIEAETGIIQLQGSYEDTALQEASAGGHETLVKLLIDMGADVNADPFQSRGQRKALWAAAGGGHEAVVKLLIDKGADVNARDDDGKVDRIYISKVVTALQATAEGGHEAVVKLLIDKGADVNAEAAVEFGRTALQVAAERGHEAVVELLIDKGADVNARAVNIYGKAALQVAAEYGHKAIVKLLIAKGADVNAEAAERSGRTALQAAAGHGHEDIVKLLIDEGADVNAKAAERSGRTALQAAAEYGHEAIVKLLIDKGADINAEAAVECGRTALQAAAECGHEAIVELLIDKGADVNKEHFGRTTLQAAVECGHETIVRVLIDRGADVNAVGIALSSGLASKRGYMGIVELLRVNGVLDKVPV